MSDPVATASVEPTNSATTHQSSNSPADFLVKMEQAVLNGVATDIREDSETWKLYLEQYKIYISDTHQVADRLAVVNQFFMTVCTAIVSGMWIFAKGLAITKEQWQSVAGASDYLNAGPTLGLLIGYAWIVTAWYYNSILQTKKRVIRGMEAHLPAKPFVAEDTYRTSKTNSRKVVRLIVMYSVPCAFLLIFASMYMGIQDGSLIDVIDVLAKHK